jgi:transcriptional regulator with GAF, ATPase, and Fis domain
VAEDSDQDAPRASLDDGVRFEKLLAELSGRFMTLDPDDLNTEIERALGAAGDYMGVDRSFVFVPSEDGARHQVTYIWTADQIAPDPEIIGTIIQDAFPWLIEKMMRREDIIVNDPGDLPEEAHRELQYCRERGVESFVMCPMYSRDFVVGTVGFDTIGRAKRWSDEDLRRLRLLGEIFANAIVRGRKDQEIKHLRERLEAENTYLREEVKTQYVYEEIVGDSDPIQQALVQAELVAPTDANVLILGETGAGKELLARAIHQQSDRAGRPLVCVNCAALASTLIESELFGREKGAYTGALSKQVGRFEIADGSTIFLDEIGELPPEVQAKLLRVLQTGEFERLGSPKTIQVDVRVIAATNRDLAQAISDGSFREDLYYRLNVFPISVPPLRERREDIPQLVWLFVKEFEKHLGRRVEQISKPDMETLQRYAWPGNVRELRNVIERAMILGSGPDLRIAPPEALDNAALADLKLDQVEKRHIVAVLDHTGWRIRGAGGAAERLGLKPTTLESRMQKLGIARRA